MNQTLCPLSASRRPNDYGLTQQELAARAPQAAICRLEDADYEAIAEALDKRVQIRFLPTKKLKVARPSASMAPS